MWQGVERRGTLLLGIQQQLRTGGPNPLYTSEACALSAHESVLAWWAGPGCIQGGPLWVPLTYDELSPMSRVPPQPSGSLLTQRLQAASLPTPVPTWHLLQKSSLVEPSRPLSHLVKLSRLPKYMTPLIGPGPLQALQIQSTRAWYLSKEKEKPE